MKTKLDSFGCRMATLIGMALLLLAPSTAWGTPTEEDILRSFNENMDQPPDYGRLIPWLFALAGAVVVVVYFRQWQKRQAVPRPLNNPRKLIREMANAIDIDPAELKRITQQAKDLNCESPLTLLLCPSLLGEESRDKT